jgi:hypothetical protein
LESLRAHFPQRPRQTHFEPNSVFFTLFPPSQSSIQFLLTTKPSAAARLFSCQLGVLKEQLGNRTENFSKKFLIAKTPAQGTKIGHPEATSSGLKTIIGLNQGFKRVR